MYDTHIYVCICIYNGLLPSNKKKWNNAIYSNMDGHRDYGIKWSKSEKDKYIILILLMRGICKKGMSELIYKAEMDSQS